jgi:hypothetical protein
VVQSSIQSKKNDEIITNDVLIHEMSLWVQVSCKRPKWWTRANRTFGYFLIIISVSWFSSKQNFSRPIFHNLKWWLHWWLNIMFMVCGIFTMCMPAQFKWKCWICDNMHLFHLFPTKYWYMGWQHFQGDYMQFVKLKLIFNMFNIHYIALNHINSQWKQVCDYWSCIIKLT